MTEYVRRRSLLHHLPYLLQIYSAVTLVLLCHTASTAARRPLTPTSAIGRCSWATNGDPRSLTLVLLRHPSHQSSCRVGVCVSLRVLVNQEDQTVTNRLIILINLSPSLLQRRQTNCRCLNTASSESTACACGHAVSFFNPSIAVPHQEQTRCHACPSSSRSSLSTHSHSVCFHSLGLKTPAQQDP